MLRVGFSPGNNTLAEKRPQNNSGDPAVELQQWRSIVACFYGRITYFINIYDFIGRLFTRPGVVLFNPFSTNGNRIVFMWGFSNNPRCFCTETSLIQRDSCARRLETIAFILLRSYWGH